MIVYFDFLCPYAWRGLELMQLLDLRPELRHFSLVQGNHAENPDRKNPTWKLAEQPSDDGPDNQQASLRAFLAGQAAKLQGEKRAFQFTLRLFRLRHQDGRDLNDPATIFEAARGAELDLAQFEGDLADDEATLRANLADNLNAAARLGVFGTPTFVLDSGDAAYFRFAQLPGNRADAERAWQLYQDVLHSGARVETVKRPK